MNRDSMVTREERLLALIRQAMAALEADLPGEAWAALNVAVKEAA
jgi:hypothetical protein